MDGTVNHGLHWRDMITGVSSNDARSEVAHVQLALRVKYDYVRNTNTPSAELRSFLMEKKLEE